ncbi:SRPBCC family protein [Limnobacter humi]|uniref:SRPBCC family protein n=1 Tax=Limnobacter humi TaxID=1778671 RepID=A0ABT1WHC4_9BURK|nr:SRPBCC family protein [Limnobacter humi]MCQ8896906.1 SRPBCC family protein [Limnobacter humi]
MKFEHLVQINDPKLPVVDWLTREQLWMGLVARAWKPTRFILGLEQAEVTEISHSGTVTTLHRRLDYGAFQVEDTIELHDELRTETRVVPNQHCGPSTLTITIEEPEQGLLWLRFQYHVQDADGLNAEDNAHSEYEEARKQAYRAADIDTVKMIRELASTLPADRGMPLRKDH